MGDRNGGGETKPQNPDRTSNSQAGRLPCPLFFTTEEERMTRFKITLQMDADETDSFIIESDTDGIDFITSPGRWKNGGRQVLRRKTLPPLVARALLVALAAAPRLPPPLFGLSAVCRRS